MLLKAYNLFYYNCSAGSLSNSVGQGVVSQWWAELEGAAAAAAAPSSSLVGVRGWGEVRVGCCQLQQLQRVSAGPRLQQQ